MELPRRAVQWAVCDAAFTMCLSGGQLLQQLLEWAQSFGKVAFGVEGAGSYGATLASFLRRAGHKVVEAGRPDRRLRRMNGKSDTLDAENAARAVLAGFATATPKTADGEAEMLRRLRSPTTRPSNSARPRWSP